MMARNEDRFANILMAEVVESGANTLTFKEILTGISLGMGIGMIIDQIDYWPPTNMGAQLVATIDRIRMGFTVSDSITELNADDRSIIHMVEFHSGGAAAVPQIHTNPIPFQFFPPIIRASPRLFLAIEGESIAAAVTAQARMYFRYIDLSTQEYLELAETGLVIG